MQDELKETDYADLSHPGIQRIAGELRAGEDDPIRIALRTFYFVRDQVPFGFDLYKRKASQVLERGYAVCWGKSLLLTTLLRCNGIPALFGTIPVRNSFVSPAIGKWSLLANNPFNHCITSAYLNGRWTILDAVLDKKTYDAFFAKGPYRVSWGIDWNGSDDVRLYTESVLGPAEICNDIDAAINKKVGNIELPETIALLGYGVVNRWMWKKAGQAIRL